MNVFIYLKICSEDVAYCLYVGCTGLQERQKKDEPSGSVSRSPHRGGKDGEKHTHLSTNKRPVSDYIEILY